MADAQQTPTKPRRKRFGRNQKIAVTALALPFVTSTAFVALGLGGATAQWWSGFVGTLVPLALAIILGGSALVQGTKAIAGAVAAKRTGS